MSGSLLVIWIKHYLKKGKDLANLLLQNEDTGKVLSINDYLNRKAVNGAQDKMKMARVRKALERYEHINKNKQLGESDGL